MIRKKGFEGEIIEKNNSAFLIESKKRAFQAATEFGIDPYIFYCYRKWEGFTERKKIKFLRLAAEKISRLMDVPRPIIGTFYEKAVDGSGREINDQKAASLLGDALFMSEKEKERVLISRSHFLPLRDPVPNRSFRACMDGDGLVDPSQTYLLLMNRNPVVLGDFWRTAFSLWHEFFHLRQCHLFESGETMGALGWGDAGKEAMPYMFSISGHEKYREQFIERDADGGARAAIKAMKKSFAQQEVLGRREPIHLESRCHLSLFRRLSGVVQHTKIKMADHFSVPQEALQKIHVKSINYTIAVTNIGLG